MAERRRGKQKKSQEGNEKPTKEEYAVAKFLRFNLPPREGKLVGMTVQCFIASKAVDALLDSKWSTAKSGNDALFTTRASCADYCDRLLQKGLFHRAAKVEKKRDKDKKKKKSKEGEVEEKEDADKVEKKAKKEKKSKKSRDKDQEEDGEKEEQGDKGKESSPKSEDKKDEDKKKRKDKKLKLEMHNQQLFKDGEEVYVWIYDPVPVKTFVIGLFLVLGAIGVCLFPLWPPEVRLGVYYLSMAAAGFVGFILSLCVVRLVLFCLVWAFTFGRHHFWFLPNLTEDVGFLDSFKPLYKHDFFAKDDSPGDASEDKASASSGSAERRENDSAETPEVEPSQVEEEKSQVSEERDEDLDQDGDEGEDDEGTGSEGNGYEIVDAEDIEDAEHQLQEEADNEPKKTK